MHPSLHPCERESRDARPHGQRGQPLRVASRLKGLVALALLLLVLLLATTTFAADKKPDLSGSLTGTVANPKGLSAVVAVDRSGEDDKRYPGKVDAATGKFTVTGLPVKGVFDVILDAGTTRLEGVNLKAPPSDFEEEQPLLKEDIVEIKKICKQLNVFENEVDVVTVVGNCQHAVAILNKRAARRRSTSRSRAR